ncbi:MAG: IS4 family transposase [Calothrix sp. SM1_7_51]|nr:IS4 family transposase [Calothrix sp. SM1_7_51]
MITNTVEILKEKFTNSLGLPFSDLLPGEKIQKTIDDLGIKYYRRIFDPVVTVWAFLSQVLDIDKSCHNAVSRIIAWLSTENVELPSTDTSAYCQARLRLPEELVKKLYRDSGELLENKVTQLQLWCGRHVNIIDTSTVSMPDTKENQLCYPQSCKQKKGCGFPIAKMGVIFSLATGAVIASVIDKLNVNDIKFARSLYEFLKPGDVLLGDRAFCSYADFYWIANRGFDAVFRKNDARKQKLETALITNQRDRIVIWHKPKSCPRGLTSSEFASLPKNLIVREISYSVNVAGFRTENVTIITTLLDTKAFPTDALIKLYYQRWNVELNFLHLKTSLGMDILRSKTPQMIRKEIYIYFLAYNLLRCLMWSAGSYYGVPPLRLSLQGTRHHFNNFLVHLSSVDSLVRHKIYFSLLAVIVHKTVPLRPNRVEPRVIKRRTKAYPKMQKPRDVLRKKLMVC